MNMLLKEKLHHMMLKLPEKIQRLFKALQLLLLNQKRPLVLKLKPQSLKQKKQPNELFYDCIFVNYLNSSIFFNYILI
jgi:hypothetical protein